MIFNLIGSAETTTKTKVIAVASESELPLEAEEGTIAILSEVDVGTTFVNAEEPFGAVEGDVWLGQGNGIVTYRIENVEVEIEKVKQQQGGEWANVDVAQYQNSVWEKRRIYLLDGNDERESVTGGWGTYHVQNGTSTKVDNGFAMTQANGGNQRGSIQTLNKIDISGMKKLYCAGYTTAAATQGIKFGIQSEQDIDYTMNDNNYAGSQPTWYSNTEEASFMSTGEFTIELDVTVGNSENYYVGVCCGTNAVITKIWMDKGK